MMLEKFTSWFQASPIKGTIYTGFWVILGVYVFSAFLVAPKYQSELTDDNYASGPRASSSASPSPSAKPLLPNTCIDSDESVISTHFNIEQARLKKKAGGLLLFLDATFVDTSRGAGSSGVPIPLVEAQGGWVKLTLQGDFEQESFMFVIANGKITIPDWATNDFTVEITGTELGVKVLLQGPVIERKTSGPFEWAVATRDQQNFWDVCPDQENSILLKRLLPYLP